MLGASCSEALPPEKNVRSEAQTKVSKVEGERLGTRSDDVAGPESNFC